MKKSGSSFVLSSRDEEILRAVFVHRYMTAVDVARLLFSPASLVYVRKRLTALAGGGDGARDQYLYRFALPSASPGNPRRVYTLGSRGRDYMVNVLGLEVDWYFRPHKVRHLSYRMVLHSLFLTRFLVAAHRFASPGSDYELTRVRTCYELASLPQESGAGEGERAVEADVIPDAWLLFEKRGETKAQFPVLLEIDRGTAYRRRFEAHITGRIEYVKKGGAYGKLFGTEAVVIAYATTGESAEYRETRRRAMCSWTMEVLREQRRQAWAPVFRFCSVDADHVYDTPLFDGCVWYRPDAEKPVRLFGN